MIQLTQVYQGTYAFGQKRDIMTSLHAILSELLAQRVGNSTVTNGFYAHMANGVGF